MTVMPRIETAMQARPVSMYLSDHSARIVREILNGTRSHKDLKIAFDWERTPEGHRFWSKVRQAPGLSREAAAKLEYAVGGATGQTSRQKVIA